MATVKILLVGGGGGGGDLGGGGGGGVVYNSAYQVYTQNYSVGVGESGAKYDTQPYGYNFRGHNGGQSGFGLLVAYGGGGGGSVNAPNSGNKDGAQGGSGGGGAIDSSNGTGYGGSAISGQGYAGGNGIYFSGSHLAYGGGGGGAGAVGESGYPISTSVGGVGVSNSITGSAVYYAGGGTEYFRNPFSQYS